MPWVGTLNEGLTRAGIHSSGHRLSKETDSALEGNGKRETGQGSNGENPEPGTAKRAGRHSERSAVRRGGEESQSSRYRGLLLAHGREKYESVITREWSVGVGSLQGLCSVRRGDWKGPAWRLNAATGNGPLRTDWPLSRSRPPYRDDCDSASSVLRSQS